MGRVQRMEKGGHTRKFHYAWVIFTCCFLSVFTSLGFGSAPKSLFLAAITENLGISRGLFSISDSCRFITTAVVNLFFGKLVAKFGPRKLIGAGFVCLALSGLISAVSSNVFGFYLANIFLGLGLAWSTTTLVGIVVEKWFTGKKGTIMGFILAANGLGGALAAQIVGPIIRGSEDGFGYRKAYLVTAAILFAVGAVVVALFMKKIAFKENDVPFVMELPPYRIPTLKSTLTHMWHKGEQYLKKMGTIILLASIIIWALGYFPTNISYEKNYDQMIEQAGENQKLITKLQLEKESERQEKSYIGRLGHTIEPLLAPCGFDWKMSVSLITGLAAKEIVVSSMGILYHADANADESSQSLISNLQKETYKSGDRVGEKVFTPLVAFCFMLFILIYFPCIATIVAIKKESNWKWALFTMFYTTLLAWFISFSVYQLFS